jgi:hypothetical protein
MSDISEELAVILAIFGGLKSYRQSVNKQTKQEEIQSEETDLCGR